MLSRPSTETSATLSTRPCVRTWRRPCTRTSVSTRWCTRRCAASTTTPSGTRLSVNTRWSCPRKRPRKLRPLLRPPRPLRSQLRSPRAGPGLRVRSRSQCTLCPRLTGCQRRLKLTSPGPGQLFPRDSGCPVLTMAETEFRGPPPSPSVPASGSRDSPLPDPDPVTDLDPVTNPDPVTNQDLATNQDRDPRQRPRPRHRPRARSRPRQGPARQSQSESQSRPAEKCPGQ